VGTRDAPHRPAGEYGSWPCLCPQCCTWPLTRF
jgi:hypothetical protein